MTKTNPTMIAKETLRLLAARQVAPTPENYRQLYQEIAGIPADSEAMGPERALQKVVADLPRTTPERARTASLLEKAVAEKDWGTCAITLAAVTGSHGTVSHAAQPWGDLIRELLRQWEAKQKGVTTARKREGLEKILSSSASDPAKMHSRLQSLVRSWSEAPAGLADPIALVDAPAEAGLFPPRRIAEAPADDTPDQLRELLAQVLECAVASRLDSASPLAREAEALAAKARQARDMAALGSLAAGLRQMCIRLELRGGEEAELREGLLRLLQLLVENVGELVVDDQRLHGQITVVRQIISDPLNVKVIADAERCLKEVIFKQGVLKHSLNEARAAFKSMVTSFIDRIGELSETTGVYHDKIEIYTRKISQTDDIGQLSQILDDVMRETKLIQANALRSRNDLLQARRQAETAEEKIRQLESELEQIGEKVREDHLTCTLNRRGMDEAFEREASRADRSGLPFSLALLDIDNFKQLNDTHGHQAGDDALVHLVQVVKESLRPSDIVARFGGEEFVVLLPDTGLDEAVSVMARLQRDLTKTFFLHQNQRLLITFSAGVALRAQGEQQDGVIARADAALYQAKQTGKNRVYAAAA